MQFLDGAVVLQRVVGQCLDSNKVLGVDITGGFPFFQGQKVVIDKELLTYLTLCEENKRNSQNDQNPSQTFGR